MFFFKYLWRHVCVLELIRVRYDKEEDVPGTVSRLFDLSFLVNRKKHQEQKRQQETKATALTYLESYGSEYWVRTDTRIKKITEELERALESDDRVAAKLSVARASDISLASGSKAAERTALKVEQEFVDRAQTIVSDFLISDLAKTVKLLGEHGFSDKQSPHYIVIDDLDKNWMPNNGMYIGLTKALLQTVRELNRQLPAAKIIVAVRSNVFRRVFSSSSSLEPQREKWRDVQLPVVWTDDQLVEFVNKRLAVIARGAYTKAPPEFKDLLPHGRSKKPEHRRGQSNGAPGALLQPPLPIPRCPATLPPWPSHCAIRPLVSRRSPSMRRSPTSSLCGIPCSRTLPSLCQLGTENSFRSVSSHSGKILARGGLGLRFALSLSASSRPEPRL